MQLILASINVWPTVVNILTDIYLSQKMYHQNKGVNPICIYLQQTLHLVTSPNHGYTTLWPKIFSSTMNAFSSPLRESYLYNVHIFMTNMGWHINLTLNIHKVTNVIRLEELSLFRAAVISSARTRVFYGNMWNSVLENKLYNGKSLLHRVLETSILRHINGALCLRYRICKCV